MASVIFRGGCITVSVKYLYVKKDGTCYYRRRVPKGLEGHYGGALIMRTLRTRDQRLAARRIAALAEQDDALWDSLRGRKSDVITQDTTRAAEALLRALAVTPGSRAAHENFRPDDPAYDDGGYPVDPLREHFEVRYGEAWHSAAGRDERRDALLTPVEREAYRLYQGGQPKLFLSDALAVYLRNHDHGDRPKFKADNTRAVETLKTIMGGNVALDAVTREHAIKFRDSFKAKGRKSHTTGREISRMSAVFNAAISEHSLKIENPFKGLKVPKEGQDAVEKPPYTDDELRIIATACRAADDEMRHIISIILDTGARAGEVVGLRVEDVVADGDLPHLRLREWGDGSVRSLKNQNSKRDIPLVGEALWGAQRALKARGKSAGWLFPRYASDAQVKATSASTALNKWTRGLPGVSKEKGLHCFRHAMRDRLRAARVPEAIQDAIGGWGTQTVGQQYGLGYSLEHRHEEMLKIVLPPPSDV